MFRLTADEAETLRSQFATSNGRGGRGLRLKPGTAPYILYL